MFRPFDETKQKTVTTNLFSLRPPEKFEQQKVTELPEDDGNDEYQRIFDQFGRKGPHVPSRRPVPPPLPRFGFVDRLDSEQFQFFNALSQEFGGLGRINVICEHRPLIRKALGATAKLCGYYLTDYEPNLVLKVVA